MPHKGLPHNKFLNIVEENRVVADQLFADIDNQFRLLRRMWVKMDAASVAEQLQTIKHKIESIEVLIGIKFDTNNQNGA